MTSLISVVYKNISIEASLSCAWHVPRAWNIQEVTPANLQGQRYVKMKLWNA